MTTHPSPILPTTTTTTPTAHAVERITTDEADAAAARTLITRLETTTHVCGLTIALAMAGWIAAMEAAHPTIALVAALIAAAVFLVALITVLVLIALGPAPAETVAGSPIHAGNTLPDARSGSGTPATGCGPTTPSSRRILRK